MTKSQHYTFCAYLIIALLLIALSPAAKALLPWEDRYANLTWTHPGTLADGSSIALSDITYTVFDAATEMAVCSTDKQECSVLMVWGMCVAYYATATDKISGLESGRSNVTQDLCTDPKPGIPLSPPVLSAGVGGSTGVLQ